MKIVQLARQPLSKRLRSRFEFTVDDETDSYDVSVGEEFYIAKTGKRPNEKIRLIVEFKNKYLAFNITQEELYEVGSLADVLQDYHKYEDKTMNHAGGRSKNYRHRSLSKDNKMLKKKVSLKSESKVRPGFTNPNFENYIEKEGFDLADVSFALDDLQMNSEMYIEELERRYENGELSKRDFESAAAALGRIDQRAHMCQNEIDSFTKLIQRNPKLYY
jgi:hypothetical protein